VVDLISPAVLEKSLQKTTTKLVASKNAQVASAGEFVNNELQV